MRKLPAVIVVVIAISGCASTLRTFDAQQQPSSGIPFRSPVLVDVERMTTFQLVSGQTTLARYCTPESTVTVEFLPIGELHFATLQSAAFGKADFSVELTDAGALKKLTIGSDPGTAAVIEATTSLASAILPFAFTQKEPADARTELVSDSSNLTAKQLKDRHCTKVKTSITNVKRRVVE